MYKMSELIFKLKMPFPPSVNGLYGGGSGQQRFKTKRYKDWCKTVQHIPGLGINYPISITYTFTWPDARARDGQNYLKAITDTMVNSGMIVDDNYKIITSETWDHAGVDKKNAGVFIRIYKV